MNAASATLVTLAVLLAGCSTAQDPASGETPPSPTTDAGDSQPQDPLAPPPWPFPRSPIHTGCRQLHLFFPSPWSGWAGTVPAGWAPDGTDPSGQTTTLYQHVSRCTTVDPADASATLDVAEVWVTGAVMPPAEYRGEGAVLYLVPTDLIVSTPRLATVYASWGYAGALKLGTISWSDTSTGGAHTSEVTTSYANATYSLRVQVAPAPTGSSPGIDRVFALDGLAVAGWFDYEWPGWTDLGSGAVEFSATGDPEAPPLYAGTAHQVADADVAVTFTAYAPEAAP